MVDTDLEIEPAADGLPMLTLTYGGGGPGGLNHTSRRDVTNDTHSPGPTPTRTTCSRTCGSPSGCPIPARTCPSTQTDPWLTSFTWCTSRATYPMSWVTRHVWAPIRAIVTPQTGRGNHHRTLFSCSCYTAYINL